MTASESDLAYMREALELAAQAEFRGEVPVGAVLVINEEIVGRGSNAPIGKVDPTAHAEILALRDAAAQRGNYRLPDSTLYVTLEPCPMCVGAILHARVARLVFGAGDSKTGALGGAGDLRDLAACNRKIEVQGGVLAEEAGRLLKNFFAARR